LLGDAVDIAATEQYLARRHADDFVLRKHAFQDGECRAIVPGVQERHHDAAIGDVKVDIRTCQAVARRAGPGALQGSYATGFFRRRVERTRLDQLVNLEAPAARIARLRQALVRIMRDFVLRIALVIGPGETHLARTHEAAQVVHVPVGLVLEYAAAQP